MENITLKKASNPFDGFKVDWQQIKFVSDIEEFTKEAGDSLLKMCLENKHKLIVFLGDILSFLEREEGYFKGLHLAQVAPELFSDKIENDEAARLVGKRLSNYLQSKYNLQFQAFLTFIKECKGKNIQIIYYSGNHDTIISNPLLSLVPVFDNFFQLGNFYVPRDLELIKVDKDLFILGVHTESTNKCTEYKQLKDFTNSLLTIENTDKIIFASHMPGTAKFVNEGSKDITTFKQRFRFKYHYHGHCKDYYGEYLEENVPTRSVHI